MSRASSVPECPCGTTCTAERTLREMMETVERYHRFQRDDIAIATILTDLGYTATVMDTCLHHWSEAVQTCETGRANLALGTGTYLRPSVPTRTLVEREERAHQRWLESERRQWEHRLRQVKHGIASHRSYLETLRSRFHLHAECLPRCLYGLGRVIEERELLLEQLSQTHFSNQEMHARWEEQWVRESARLEHEIAQMPHAYQAGLQLGQSQQVRFILTGINKPVPQMHLQSHYGLRVLERQLELSSQHARRFLILRRETWTLFIQRTEIESHMTVLTALLEQWYHLQSTLEQPLSVDLVSLGALILSSFTI